MITYKLLDRYNEIAHFCTTRQGGTSVGNYASFNLSPFAGDKTNAFAANLNKLENILAINSSRIIIPFQTHGTEIKEIDADFFKLTDDKKSEYLNAVDGIFTRIPKVCVGVTTADCVPLLFYNPTKQIIAAVHAGWRGTCGRIAEKTISALVETYNCKPEEIIVTIGPSISVLMYEVKQDVIDNFDKAGFNTAEIVEKRNGALFLDLWKANIQSLRKAGVLSENIEVAGICTYTDNELFFSARKLGIKSGRMLSGIMLK